MENSVKQYLEAQILTATPQKLRLLLIDGAIRCSMQAMELWDQNQNEKALEAIIRARNIVSELLAGIRQDHTELTRRVAEVYMFLFRTLTDAQLRRDRDKVRSAIQVLEVERETWRLVCEKLPGRPFAMDQAGYLGGNSQEILAPTTAIGGPPNSGFALDA